MGPGCLPCHDDFEVHGVAVPDEVGQQLSRVTPTCFIACYERVLIKVLIKIKDTKSLIFPKGSSRRPQRGANAKLFHEQYYDRFLERMEKGKRYQRESEMS